MNTSQSSSKAMSKSSRAQPGLAKTKKAKKITSRTTLARVASKPKKIKNQMDEKSAPKSDLFED